MKAIGRWWLSILIMCLLFYLSSRPGSYLAPTYLGNALANKAAHLLWYGMLCLSFYKATKSIPVAILLTTLYGVSDEIHQVFVFNRTGKIADVAIDWAAASFVGLILWKFYPYLPNKLKSWLEK